jgi:cobalt-zinc-cadmium efflux system outer membrane protein
MYRMLAALWAAGACATALQAQNNSPTATSPVLTLAEALDRAGATSPSIAAASAGMQAAAAQRRVAGLRPNPMLDVEAENVAGTGMFEGLRAAETTVSLAVPIERGGKRNARVGVADAEATRAALQAAVARANLRLRITQAYVAAVAAARRFANAREQLGIAAEVLRAAHVRVQAGRASPLEEQRADVAHITAGGVAEREARNARGAAEALARLIDSPVTALDLAWFDHLDGTGPRLPSSREGTLAFAMAEADVATARAQVRLAQSQRVPDFTVSAGARRLEASNDLAAVIGLSIPIPIFNNGRPAIDLAIAQQQQVEAQRRSALLDAEQAIASAELDAANAAASARIATGHALAGAQEAARIARIGYREGKFGQLDLLEAERTLAETRASAIDALAAHHDAEARLERLTAPAPTITDRNR